MRGYPKIPKPMQANDSGDHDTKEDNSLWHQYVGTHVENQPKFIDASRMKHAHEGFVGFNQVAANIFSTLDKKL